LLYLQWLGHAALDRDAIMKDTRVLLEKSGHDVAQCTNADKSCPQSDNEDIDRADSVRDVPQPSSRSGIILASLEYATGSHFDG